MSAHPAGRGRQLIQCSDSTGATSSEATRHARLQHLGPSSVQNHNLSLADQIRRRRDHISNELFHTMVVLVQFNALLREWAQPLGQITLAQMRPSNNSITRSEDE